MRFREPALCLGEILKEESLGAWKGYVRIPETSTRFYYGPDAQAMFGAIEPTLGATPGLRAAYMYRTR